MPRAWAASSRPSNAEPPFPARAIYRPDCCGSASGANIPTTSGGTSNRPLRRDAACQRPDRPRSRAPARIAWRAAGCRRHQRAQSPGLARRPQPPAGRRRSRASQRSHLSFWIAEHHDGRCVVMFDESPYDASTPVDVSPNELRRALVLVPLDPTRPSGKVPPRPAGAAGVVEALLTANHAEDAIGDPQERRAARRAWRRRRPLLRRYRHLLGEREARPGTDAHRSARF